MSDITSLLTYVEGKIAYLEGDNAGVYASEIDRTLAMWIQAQGAFLLAHETKRIADLLVRLTHGDTEEHKTYEDEETPLSLNTWDGK